MLGAEPVAAPGAITYFNRAVETLDPDALQALSLQRLETLVAEVGAENAFYRRLWHQAGLSEVPVIRSRRDLARLPLTTKDQLVVDQLEHPPYGTVLTYPLDHYVRYHQTSGTTGVPIRWLDTRESWAWWTRCWSFVLRAAGVGPGDRVMFGFSFGPFIGFWAGFEAASSIGALTLPGGGQSSKLRAHLLGDAAATVLVCTPSYALHLAEVAREEGIDPAATAVRTTIHAGEPGASIPATKRRIEEQWGAVSYDHYGLTEVGAMGFECQAHPGGIHVNEAEFVVEVLDPDSGEVAAEGEGELVVTNLGRRGSPLIRYRTRDRVRLVRDPCPCGRTFARLDGGVRGRSDDMLVVRGVNVFPSAIEDAVRRHPSVDEFRIEVFRQDHMDQVRVLLELHAGSSAEERNREVLTVAEEIRIRLGIRVDALAVPEGTLPRPELKAKRVVRVDAMGPDPS